VRPKSREETPRRAAIPRGQSRYRGARTSATSAASQSAPAHGFGGVSFAQQQRSAKRCWRGPPVVALRSRWADDPAVVCQDLRRPAPAWSDGRHFCRPQIVACPSQRGAARLDRGRGTAAWAALNSYHPQDRGTRKHNCCRSGADRGTPG
jgi:hypothetical protein